MKTVFVPVDGVPREPLRILIETNMVKNEIAVTAYNSIFITTSPMQSLVIQSEMNRMLVEHFGGTWIVNEEYVQFTIPFV